MAKIILSNFIHNPQKQREIETLRSSTINRNRIALRFFNMAMDLALYDPYFIFAKEFCGYIALLAEAKDEGGRHKESALGISRARPQ